MVDLWTNLWCNNSKANFFLDGHFFLLKFPLFPPKIHVSFVQYVIMLGGPPQRFLRKSLLSTLHTFILGSRNSDIGSTVKSHISLIIQNSPSNPLTSIRSLFETWLPLYTIIPYLLNVSAWGGIFGCTNVVWFFFKVSPIGMHTDVVPKSTLRKYYWSHDQSAIVKSYRKFKDAARN